MKRPEAAGFPLPLMEVSVDPADSDGPLVTRENYPKVLLSEMLEDLIGLEHGTEIWVRDRGTATHFVGSGGGTEDAAREEACALREALASALAPVVTRLDRVIEVRVRATVTTATEDERDTGGAKRPGVDPRPWSRRGFRTCACGETVIWHSIEGEPHFSHRNGRRHQEWLKLRLELAMRRRGADTRVNTPEERILTLIDEEVATRTDVSKVHLLESLILRLESRLDAGRAELEDERRAELEDQRERER